MRLLLSFVIFCFSISCAIGQQQQVDSLTNIIRTSKEDTIILKAYYEIANIYLKSDIVLATAYIDSLESSAIEMNRPKFELTAQSQKGIIEYRKGNFQNAIDIWRSALNHEKIDRFAIQKGNLLNNIAIGFKVFKENDSVLNYMMKSIEINELKNNTEALVANYFSISDFYASIEDNDNAIKYLKKLEDIAISTDNYNALARTYILLAAISRREFDHEDSISFFKQALELYQKNDPLNIIMKRGLMLEIAITQINNKQYDDAIKVLEEINNLIDSSEKDNSFLTSVNSRLLWCYLNINNKEKAGAKYKYLLEVELPESVISQTLQLFNLSSYEIAFGRPNEITLNRLIQADELARNSKDYSLIRDIQLAISKYYLSINDYKSSRDALEMSMMYLDSLRRTETKAINLSQKRKFNEAVKDKELAQKIAENQRQQIEKQRLWIVILIICAVLVGLLLLYLSLKAKHLKQENIYQKAVTEKKQLEREVLQLEIKQSKLKELSNEQDFHGFLLKRFNLEEEELLLWKLISDGLDQTQQADNLNASVNTIKTWKRTRLYPKLRAVVMISKDYNQHTATQLYKDEIKRFYNMRFQKGFD